METLTKEIIQTKNSKELKQIARELDVKGYSRKPKSIVQQMILLKLQKKEELSNEQTLENTKEESTNGSTEEKEEIKPTSPVTKSPTGPIKLDWLTLENLFIEHKDDSENEILYDDLYDWLLIRFNVDVVDQIKEFTTPVWDIDWKEFREFVQSFIPKTKEKVESKPKSKQSISHKVLLEFTEEQKEKTKEVMESSVLKTKRSKMITLIRMGITRQQMIKLLDFEMTYVYELYATYVRDNTVFDKELPL